MALKFYTSVAPFLPSLIGLKDCSNLYYNYNYVKRDLIGELNWVAVMAKPEIRFHL